jgi:F0F1-type ATP synthase membrane subunit b/b'
MSQPGFFAHYSGVAHRASRRYDQLVQQEKLVYASLDNEVRKTAAADSEKVTEPVVKNRILLDSRHRKITERMLDAKAVAGMTKDACESFKQRRDMLIQVGANIREESKGELRMRSRQDAADGRKEHAMETLRNAQGG